MFRVSDAPLDIEALSASLENHAAGALVSFEGRVRKMNDGRAVARLEYELFAELCIDEGNRILEEAKRLFPLHGVEAVHRYGSLELGDAAVWVGVTAAHRGAAFQACRFIIDAIKSRCPIWKKEHYKEGPTEWIGCPTCEHHAAAATEVFSRQQRLVGGEGQHSLKNSRVLIVGAGGLGCPAALNLAAAGVGFLRISDGDRLEASNLHRQTLYSYHDVGGMKAILAKRRLEELHPYTEIEAVAEAFTPANADNLLVDIDLVLDCTDNFAAKYLINDRCVAEAIPYVQASIFQNQAQLYSYRPDRSACLRCSRPEQPPADCVESCTDAGVLGAATSIVGSWQALESIRTLLGQESVALDSTLYFDMEQADQFTVRRHKDPHCPACSAQRSGTVFRYEEEEPLEPGEISYEALPAVHAQLVDIREPHEARPSLPGSKRMPLSTLDQKFFADRSEQAFVVFCEKGSRSRALVRQLRAQGFEHVTSLKGGLSGIPEAVSKPIEKATTPQIQ